MMTVQSEATTKLDNTLCGRFVCSFIAREGSYFPCALPSGHEGACKAGGNCFTHGHYVNYKPYVPPACPQCDHDIKIAVSKSVPVGTIFLRPSDAYEPTLDPTLVQQRPTALDTEQDVGHFVVSHLTSMHLSKVAIDHEKRIDFGEKKYGQRLKTNNGRDWLMDCYQEILDGISYSAQGALEGDDRWLLHDLSILAGRVREKLTSERRRP